MDTTTSENGSRKTIPGRLDYEHTHKVHLWLLSLKVDDVTRSSSTDLAQRATLVLAFNVSASTINSLRYGVMKITSRRGPAAPKGGALAGKIEALEKRVELHERWITEAYRQLGIEVPSFTLEG